MATPDFPIPAELAVDDEPFSLLDLDLYLDAADAEEADELGLRIIPEHVEGWRIEDDAAAEWAGRHLSLANAEVQRLTELAAEWQARIQFWLLQQTKRPRDTVAFFEGHLTDYALRVRLAGGARTLTLPSVTVKTTEHKPAVQVDDDEAVAKWIGDHCTLGDYERAFGDPALPETPLWPVLSKATTKVYVAPLRKLIHVEEIDEDAWDWTATLACGHEIGGTVPIPDDFDVPSRGDRVSCAYCPEIESDDPGTQPTSATSTVELVVSRRRKHLAAVGPNGEEVPGTFVSARTFDASVVPR